VHLNVEWPTEEDEVAHRHRIEDVPRACIMAEALKGGDIDALVECSDFLEASGMSETSTSFVFQLLFELLPRSGRGPGGRS